MAKRPVVLQHHPSKNTNISGGRRTPCHLFKDKKVEVTNDGAGEWVDGGRVTARASIA